MPAEERGEHATLHELLKCLTVSAEGRQAGFYPLPSQRIRADLHVRLYGRWPYWRLTLLRL